MPKEFRSFFGKGDEPEPDKDKQKSAEENIIESLIGGDSGAFREAGGKFVPSRSAEEIRRLGEIAHDEEIKRVLGKDKKSGKSEKTSDSNELSEEKEGFDDEGKKSRMNEANPEWARNLEQDSIRGKLYLFIEENFPEFRIKTVEGEKKPKIIHVEATPYETDRDTLRAIEHNPIFRILAINPNDPRSKDVIKNGHELEEKDEIPKETTNRALVYFYNFEIRQLEKMIESPVIESKRPHLFVIKKYKKEIEELGVEPLTNEEIEKLFRQIIDQEIENQKKRFET